MTVKEIVEYSDSLKDSLNKSDASFLYNNDRAHNAAIVQTMLEQSKQINMFCGEMSVFREGFYEHIKVKDGQELSDYLREQLILNLKDFLAKEDSCINIIFESFDNSYLNDLLIPDVIYREMQNGKINCYMLDENLDIKKDISHFSYTSYPPIVRLEDDKMKHTALCIIKNEKYTSDAECSFQKLLKVASSINISQC